MKIWRLAIPAVVLFLAAAGMNGCYTMLIHPPVSAVDDVTGMKNSAEVNYGERCTDCHTGNAHSSPSGLGGHVGRADGWNDYDPYWGNDYNGYYDPWFMGSSMYSPYFYDNYYRYNTIPWWLYDSKQVPNGSGEQATPREKPIRRGVGISDRNRENSTPSVGSTPRPSGAEKQSPPDTKKEGTSSDDTDSDKQKPVRRGGIK